MFFTASSICVFARRPDGEVFSMMDGGSSVYSRLQSFHLKTALDDSACSMSVCRRWPSFATWWNMLP